VKLPAGGGVGFAMRTARLRSRGTLAGLVDADGRNLTQSPRRDNGRRRVECARRDAYAARRMSPDHPIHPHGTTTMPAALRWSIGPTLAFAAMLVALLAMALWARWVPPARPSGMPADPEVTAARDALGGELPLPVRGLVLVSGFAGESPRVDPDSVPLGRLTAAHGLLAVAARRHPGEPRLATALTHLELAAGRFERAEMDYRVVLDRVPHYGEARLGLGIALALRAGWDPRRMPGSTDRGPALEALAQFANVDRDDPAHWAALFDAALVATTVGRSGAAEAAIDEALAGGVPAEWAARYRALRATAAR
jgi:hypothetical protein